jgi:hypothetical protein
MMPVAASMRACASEPAMSTSARRKSKPMDALKRCIRPVIGSAKRPDHAPAPEVEAVLLVTGPGFAESDMGGERFTSQKSRVLALQV